MVVAPGSLLSGDMMAVGHLFWLVRSAGKNHVGVAGVLLLVPFKTYESSSSGGWSASTRLIWPLATRTTGRSLQRSECNFFFFLGYLCKCWDENHHKFI